MLWPRLAASLLLAVLMLGVLFGCGGDGAAGDSTWTVEEGALTLERDLLAGDDEEYYFGRVGDVAVRADGQMYVVDNEAVHLKILAPDGTLQNTIGREGEGPGEFQELRHIIVGRDDSLFVTDPEQRLISVFDPAGDFAYSVRTKSLALRELMVPHVQSGFVLGYTQSPVSSGEKRNFIVQRTDAAGAAGDTLVVGEGTKWHSPLEGLYLAVPFSPDAHVALGPEDKIHYGRGDSVSISRYALSGERETTVTIPFRPMPVTDEERKEALKRYTGERSIPSTLVPSTKPAFYDFLIDDDGRYWFRRPTSDSDSTAWWVANPDEKRVATSRLADDVSLLTVRGGYAYGRTTAESGAPTLVRYRVDTGS